MQGKLTLSVDKEVIKRAKDYSKKKGISLSSLVENFLKGLSGSEESQDVVTVRKGSLVDQLTGVIELPENFDEREALTEILMEKYLKG